MPRQLAKKSIDLITNGNSKSYQSSPIRISGNSGFSLFELVVFIISVAIIYSYAANRFSEFPAQAERANFTAIIAQLQTSINLELMFGMGAGGLQNAGLLAGINPMDLMLSPPINYLGALSSPDPVGLPRRSWYFDLNTEELVYLVNDASGVFVEYNGSRVATDILRFKVSVANRKFDPVTGLDASVAARAYPERVVATHEEFGGILLQPVFPFVWAPGNAQELDATAFLVNSQ